MPKFNSTELTEKEKHVLELTKLGQTADQIGIVYGVTAERIKKIRRTARLKLAARQREQR